MSDITVVVPTRNRARFLQDSLTSILAQDVDLVVKVVRTAGDTEVPTVPAVADPRVEVLECSHSHRGADGWAVGLTTVTTPWTMTFDDDDMLVPGSVRRLLDLAVEHDLDLASGLAVDVTAGVSWSDIDDVYEQARRYEELDDETVARVSLYTWTDVAGGFFPGMGKSLWRSELNAEVTGERQPPPADSFFATKLFAASTRAGFCRVVLRAHRVHPDSATATIVGEELRERARHYLRWASSTYPEFAAARNAAFTARLAGG